MHDRARGRDSLSTLAQALRYLVAKLVTRRERWGLSLPGWLLLLACASGASALLLYTIYPFLAVTEPVAGEILVVEGWVHDYAITAAIEELNRRGAREIFTTGGPVRGSGLGIQTDDFGTIAHVGAGRLRAFGVPEEIIEMVPAHDVGRDRTFASAVALRAWLRAHGREVRSLDVVTESVHARRTQLLFQEAFGSTARVGIIAAYDPDYDPKHWWRYSEGVREVIGETVAYLYAKLFFWPSKQEN